MNVSYKAPPTPSPGETVVPSPTTTTTTTPSMSQLPVTGPSGPDGTAWGALALGVVILAVGVSAVVAARVRRLREV